MDPYNNEVVNVYIIDVSQMLYRGSYGNKEYVTSGKMVLGEDGKYRFNERILVSGIRFVLRRLKVYLQKGVVCLAFDSDNVIKKQNNPYYKAGRGTVHEDLNIKEQSNYLYNLLSKHGFNCYRVDGYEADDILQTLTYQLLGDELVDKIYLVNKDKDLYHLCNSERVIFTIDGNKNTPIQYYGVKKPYKDEEPKKSLYERLLFGKASNAIPSLRAEGLTDQALDIKLQALGIAIDRGICPAEVASDPVAFKEYFLSNIGTYNELLNRMYLLYPVLLDWETFDIDFSRKNAINSQITIRLEDEYAQ